MFGGAPGDFLVRQSRVWPPRPRWYGGSHASLRIRKDIHADLKGGEAGKFSRFFSHRFVAPSSCFFIVLNELGLILAPLLKTVVALLHKFSH